MHSHSGEWKPEETLLYIASHPFDERLEFEDFAKETPEEYKNVCLSYSS